MKIRYEKQIDLFFTEDEVTILNEPAKKNSKDSYIGNSIAKFLFNCNVINSINDFRLGGYSWSEGKGATANGFIIVEEIHTSFHPSIKLLKD